ncbi:EscU/YscU/HrcU family type III secretion system export apparatus switch protein (plasmid) [Rhizobium leguminosarum]|uniref:EscU/YscU/HrcU family type III secretion system export apparatus switch protein n=1 Tax=Rhizobium TaxID=379 RepID=UPI0010304ED6|nr:MULTISPECIES: EscU/YscU/HrcU family type III secretion system export apparatus switch protein [Rhizobium]MBY5378389.1 EscU/YscU/HrcU family type III secretion system export apparatus switch protein [Rhizobium leguminosarum]TBF35135.1 EscU/YscU/HrcU family type III secretion system export apparatus switch protein [Rhizobium leguminosarum]TBF87965.1 EscU/YscU/HrcU family type III secretion system export apparatus switch protein [Rhizobium leguminosarum]WSH48677.1 EscU/YscU/HrcU family type III
MSETSEEKSLPASDKKMRDARQKGQVAKSQDLVAGIVIFASITYLVFALAGAQTRIEQLIDLVARRVHTDPFAELWPLMLTLAGDILTRLSVPLLAVTVAAIVLTNLMVMRGFVFSVTPITPNFENISPVSGAKRIFSMRGVVEFLKALFKVAVLAIAFVMIFRTGLQALMLSSTCGAPCISNTFTALLQPLIVTATIAFIIVGLIDVMVQNWLFQRDMKMTKSEQKRERRDAEGDPAILQQRRKDRREMQAYATKTGLTNASLLVGTPDGWTVGIRYVRGETPVPMIVCRASPSQSRATITEALLIDIPVIRDGVLASSIARAVRAGEPVPETMFQRVADVLVAVKVI